MTVPRRGLCVLLLVGLVARCTPSRVGGILSLVPGLRLEVGRGESANPSIAPACLAKTARAASIAWVSLPPGALEVARTETTQTQYAACLDDGCCAPPTCDWDWTPARGDHPVTCLSWYQGQAFCAWAGGRLPTGAEWEAAARSGGRSWSHPWGDAQASCTRAIMNDSDAGCGHVDTAAVCSLPAGNSLQGVCDLVGNVWEWVADGDDERRVLRGGSWVDRDDASLRADVAIERPPDAQFANYGVRCVRSAGSGAGEP